MVGHEGEPASNSRSFFEEVSGQNNVDSSEDSSQDYSSSTFGTLEDQEYVRGVFEDSRNFEGQEEGYSAEGIEVSINEEGFEYEIAEDVEDEVAKEFVYGIVKSFEGGEGAMPGIEQEIEDRTKEPVTDGGYDTGIPIGGGQNIVSDNSEQDDSWENLPI